MDQQRSSICVSIHNVEFAKDFNYFLTVQLNSDGEKRRTDISACVANPVFTANVFILPLNNFKLDINDRLHICAFIVADRESHPSKDLESKGQARLLGEAFLSLGPLTSPLTDISGQGVKQHIKFTRQVNDKGEVTVGKCVLNLKLVGEEQFPIGENISWKPLENDEIFPQLPNSNPFMDFVWRVRVDIRCGVDLPLNRNSVNGLPSCYVETGWVLYDKSLPSTEGLFMTSIVEGNRHPIWNQQFLITNPQNIIEKDGFLYFCLKDKYNSEVIDAFYVPLRTMQAFNPYNLIFLSSKKEYEARGKLYISICLEMLSPDKLNDSLCDIVVHMMHFDPLPLTDKIFLIMTLNGHIPNALPFLEVDLLSPKNIASYLQSASVPNQRAFFSSILPIPPKIVDNLYQGICVFTLPKSMLRESVAFFIGGRDESLGSLNALPNRVGGHSDIADEMLQRLLFAKDKSNALLPITWPKESPLYPVFYTSKCMLELAVYGSEDAKNILLKAKSTLNLEKANFNIGKNEESTNPYSKFYDPGYQPIMPSGDVGGERERWEILSRELAQKQELIHRMIKEIDDKTDALKITGSEIVDLRRQIKLLQSENAILRKRLAHEEQIEIGSLVSKEIAKMSVEELKAKIIKIAQAYRDERVRNEEFDKALKAAQKDIAQARQMQMELEALQTSHQQNAKKLLAMQSEIGKSELYKETIKKQEKVISKLEKLMENSLKDTQKAREAMVEYEQIKTENINLQKQLKSMAYGPTGENSELERYKLECAKLERIISELKEDLKSKRPTTSYGNDLEREKLELEVKLQRTNARVEALQEEMTDSARNFAKEIANLKMIIAEKQALLDSLNYD